MWRDRARRSWSVASGGDPSSLRRRRTATPRPTDSIPRSRPVRRAWAAAFFLGVAIPAASLPSESKMPPGKREEQGPQSAPMILASIPTPHVGFGVVSRKAGGRNRGAARPAGRGSATHRLGAGGVADELPRDRASSRPDRQRAQGSPGAGRPDRRRARPRGDRARDRRRRRRRRDRQGATRRRARRAGRELRSTRST